MSHEVETMAYRKETEQDVPWHGLGNPIHHDAQPDEMLIEAGLNWTVSKRKLWYPKNPDIPSDSFQMTQDDIFALVRDSDDKFLGPCGKDYIPTQNAQAFDFFKKFTDAGQMRMETAGSLMGGKQIWVLAKMISSFKLPGGDEIRGYLLLSSPHIWGKSFIMKFVTIRVVCNNTFVMAMRESSSSPSFRMAHTREFDEKVAAEAETALGLAESMLTDFEADATLLASAQVKPQVVINYIADIYQPKLITDAFGTSFYRLNAKRQAELLCDEKSTVINAGMFNSNSSRTLRAYASSPGASLDSSKDTMWGAFNAVTYFIDHVSGRNRDNALHSAWFGMKAVEKTKAFQSAKHISEVVLA